MTKEQKAKEIISQILHESDSYEDWVRWISEGLEEYAALKAQLLVDTLQKVVDWQFPETGKFWDKDQMEPMSYAAAYGSNGERDYMRGIAKDALASYAGSAEQAKKKVSRFEYAIMQSVNPEKAKDFEPYTENEEMDARVSNLRAQASKLRIQAGSAEGEKAVELPERIKELFAEAEKTIADIKEAMPGAKKELRRLNEQQARVVEGVKENNPVSLLKELREKSVQRAIEGFKTYKNVPLTYWTTALAGEMGELCNMVKKMERVNNGGIDAGSSYTAASITPEMLKEEVGGIAIYLDLLASLLDIDLASAIVDTFNEKSVKYAFPYLLQEPPAATNQEGM